MGARGGGATAVLALLAILTLLFAGAARADEIAAGNGDTVTGFLAGTDRVAPIRVDLPAGAKLKLKLKSKGPGGLLPSLAIDGPTGADLTDLLAMRVKRNGASISAELDPVPASGAWRIRVGADANSGTFVLGLKIAPPRKLSDDLAVPAGGTAELAFDALGGSRVKLTAVHTDGAGAPVLDTLVGPDEAPVDLGAARLKVKGVKTKATLTLPAGTGTYRLGIGLPGVDAGSVSVKLSVKAPRPQKAKLEHPGADVIGGLAIETTTMPAGQTGAAYSADVTASGGTPPYAFSLDSGAWPDGVGMAADGHVSGVPTGSGTFDVTVAVADSADPPATATRSLSLLVTGAATTPSWSLLSPSGTAPAGRSSPGFAYDPVNGRMIVALGSTGSSGFPPVYGDTAALSLGASPSWAALGTGPSARWGPSLVTDTARSRALLYGGNVDGFQTNGEVWALDLTSPSGGWTRLSPTGGPPPVRLSHVAVYDEENDRMIVFGGGTGVAPGTSSMNDVWELSFASSAQGVWTQRTPASSPPAREFSGGVYDRDGERLVIFGGMTVTQQFGDTWSLDLSTPGSETWTELSPSGTPPAARDEHTAVLDSAHRRMIVFGGKVGQSDTNEAWALDLTGGAEAWALLAPDGTPPSARDSHAAVYDPVGGRMIVYSGFQGFPSTPFTDVWELRLP